MTWRDGVFAQIQAMTGPQGEGSIDGLCAAAKVSRASFYRHWSATEPAREEMALRDAIQRLALENRHYGYWRIGAMLRREGWCVNAKRVLRITREDNLLCLRKRAYVPATTDSNHGWRVYPNLQSARLAGTRTHCGVKSGHTPISPRSWVIREGRQCARAVDEFVMGETNLPR